MSGTTYNVKLVLYRDCGGIALPTTAPVSLRIASTNALVTSLSLPRTGVIDRSLLCPGQVSRCVNAGGVPGVEEHTYSADLNLSVTAGQSYKLVYDVAARPAGITNLVSPGSQNLYLSANLTHNPSSPNSSPSFINPPSGRFCVGQTATISLNAFDPDGDAIQYFLVNARGANGNSVPYAGGFSGINPVSSASGVTINISTGQITFTPTVISQRCVFAVRADEYRSGVKIGEVYRDFEINTINCSGNSTPVIAPITNAIVPIGSSVCRTISVTDADLDALTLTATSGILPPATFTITSNVPGEVTADFCFTATPANYGNTYAVTINANDDNCPSIATAVATFNITVPAVCNVTTSTSATPATCGLADGTATASLIGGLAPYSFSWVGPGGYTAAADTAKNMPAGTYTVTIVDGNGCVGVSTVTVQSTGSLISLSPQITNTACGLANGALDITASNGIAPYTFSLDGGPGQNSGQFTNLAAGTYTVTVSDNTGCPATGVYTINPSVDATAPVAQCKPFTLALDANGNGVLYPADVDDNSFDACSAVTLSVSPFEFSCTDLGTNTVTLTVTDATLNSSTCTAVVTVIDNIAPDVECKPFTLVLDANGEATLNASDVYDHDHEACTVTGLSLSQSTFNCSNLGPNTVILYATDNSNNVGQCNASVTVVDNLAPVPVVDPLPQVNAECSVTVSAPTAIDNCAGTVTATTNDPTSFSAQGTYSITWTYDDGNGNTSSQTQTVIVQDVTAPLAACKNMTLDLSAGSGIITAADIDNGSSDNCGIATMTVSPNTFTCSNAGVNTVTLTVTDIAGLVSTCTAEVLVQYQPSCSISVTPSNTVYTGGVPTSIYLGYGPQAATLKANATGGSGFTYSWAPATFLSNPAIQSPVFAPTAAGNYSYTVTVTNSNGCVTTCTVDLCVFDIRVYGKNNSNTGKVYLCHIPPGNSANPQQLTISTSAVPAHIGLHAGDHLGLCGTICGGSNKTGEPENGSVLELPETGFSYSVYPNPSGNTFCLEMASEEFRDARLEIMDMTGRMIYRNERVQMFSKFCFGDQLIPGVYIMRLSNGDVVYTEKLIKSNH